VNLGDLTPKKGAIKKRKRIGRGVGSGHGKTSTRGGKGQTARNTVSPWFEGGQMPLQRRTPKRGFKNPAKRHFHVVNLDDFARCEGASPITPQVLAERGVIKNTKLPVKVLGDGDLTAAIEVHAQAFSKSARVKIESKGGKVTWLDTAGAPTVAPKAKRPRKPQWGEGSRKKVKEPKAAAPAGDKKAKAKAAPGAPAKAKAPGKGKS
jgi:large subunit ribosomal protein L15